MKTTVTITIEGTLLTVEGFFTPEERQTWEHPGASAEFEIESVTLAKPDADIYDLIVSAISMEDIANKAMEAMSEGIDE
jgi:hypothetical protein